MTSFMKFMSPFVFRPYKLNTSRSSRLSLSFNEDDNIPDDIEPKQSSPRSSAKQQPVVDNFAALETMSIGSPRKSSSRYLSKLLFFVLLFCLNYSQINRTVVKAFALQADGLGTNSPSGYKVGHPGHSKYVWVGQYAPSCLKFPSLVLEDKI